MWQNDNYNRSWYKRCNNIVSYEFLRIHRRLLICDYIYLNACYSMVFTVVVS